MKTVGFGLLLAGWLLVLSALALLKAATPRGAFILAGMAVEVMGLTMVIRSSLARTNLAPHKPDQF